MKLDDIFVVVSFGRLVLSSVFEFRSFNFIYHLRWAYVQILLRDAVKPSLAALRFHP